MALAGVLVIATLTAALAGGGTTALAVGLVLCAPAALALAACAAFSATQDPYAFILSPPIANAFAFGPLLAAAALVGIPLIVAQQAERHAGSAVSAALAGGVFVAALAALGVRALAFVFTNRDAAKA